VYVKGGVSIYSDIAHPQVVAVVVGSVYHSVTMLGHSVSSI
jgi:hypothetical protein